MAASPRVLQDPASTAACAASRTTRSALTTDRPASSVSNPDAGTAPDRRAKRVVGNPSPEEFCGIRAASFASGGTRSRARCRSQRGFAAGGGGRGRCVSTPGRTALGPGTRELPTPAGRPHECPAIGHARARRRTLRARPLHPIPEEHEGQLEPDDEPRCLRRPERTELIARQGGCARSCAADALARGPVAGSGIRNRHRMGANRSGHGLQRPRMARHTRLHAGVADHSVDLSGNNRTLVVWRPDVRGLGRSGRRSATSVYRGDAQPLFSARKELRLGAQPDNRWFSGSRFSLFLDRQLVGADLRAWREFSLVQAAVDARLHDQSCVFRPIVTGRSGIVTADSGIVTGRSGDVTEGCLEGFEGCV